MSNPFLYGPPVPPDRFWDRRQAVNRIVGRLSNQGQSTAVVGEPRSGKTSLLLYLAVPELRDELYGSHAQHMVFSFVDNQTLSSDCEQAAFWDLLLRPFYERAVRPQPTSALGQALRTCRENDFGTYTLERLLAQMREDGWRLVLLLDEFDALLYHAKLSCAEFFGGLRSLASRSQGALALVIASRVPLARLNEATQQFSRTGSPYFNFLSEVTLGSFPNKAITQLLHQAGDRFMAADRRLIVSISGGHPYLLQVAAHEVWAAYSEGLDDAYARWKQASTRVYDEAALTISDIWRLWSPQVRMAFTAAALPQMALDDRKFRERNLLDDLRDLGPELRMLEKQGFVVQDEETKAWRVRPLAFLWWLADEVVRSVRDEPSYEDWLQEQELAGLLTRAQKKELGKATLAVGEMLQDGAKALIEVAARGAAGKMMGA